MLNTDALEYKSDLFSGFYLGGDVVLAQFVRAPSFKRVWPLHVEHIGDRAYATLDTGVAVRLA